MNIDRAKLTINRVKANLPQIIVAEDYETMRQKKNTLTAEIRGWVNRWVSETITTKELWDYCDQRYIEAEQLAEDLDQMQQQLEDFLGDDYTSNSEPLIILNELLGK